MPAEPARSRAGSADAARRRPRQRAQGLLGRPVGQRGERRCAASAPTCGCARGPGASASWPRSSARASACRASSWRRSAASSSCSRASAGSVRAQRQQHRQGRHALAQVGARASCRTRSASEAMSIRSSASWKATPSRSPYSRMHLDGLRRRSRRTSRRSGRGRDEHAGLVGEHAEVVVDRVGALGRGPVVADLARAQPHEGLRLDLDRLGAEVGDDLGGLAEEQVADQDRRRVAVARRWRWAPRGARRASSMTSSW